MELEPVIKIPRLESNRALPENVLFVNNMVIEEPEHGIFFTDEFGDQAFQRWSDIEKVGMKALVSYLVATSMIIGPCNHLMKYILVELSILKRLSINQYEKKHSLLGIIDLMDKRNNTIKKLKKSLNEPERELHRRRRTASRQQQNDSLAIVGRNLFDNKTSSSANSKPKSTPPLKSLREHSSPNSAGFNPTSSPSWNTKWLLVQIFHNNISPNDCGRLDQFAHFHFNSLNEEEGWNHIKEYVQYQDDSWSDPPPPMNVSSISEIIEPTLEGWLRKSEELTYTHPHTRLHRVRQPSTTLKEQLKIRPKGEETTTTQNKETPQSPTLYYPSKTSSVPYPSQLKKQKKDDDDERLLSIFSPIHINLPFLEAMIHMPKGAKELALKGGRPKEFHTTMSYQTFGSEKCFGQPRGYFQIPIALEDQEKTTFTCSYGTFAYKRMLFRLCNASATFQCCMMAIFHELIEDSMEVFMDDFSVFESSFDHCLENLEKMLKRYEDTNLLLHWEKFHIMVKEGIVLGHKVFGSRIEVDKAKIESISKLPYPTNVKAI
ncbi:reverse transcriptase domain-containing protein [Tanacetum coccineum]